MNARPFLQAAKILSVLVLAGAILGSGCDRYRPEHKLPAGHVVPAQACPSWRWIGVKSDPDGPCPPLKGWTVLPLFQEPDAETYRGQDSRPQPLPAGLRPFCVYEQRRGRGAELTRKDIPGLSALDKDCMAVLPAASDFQKALLPQLEPRFFREAGRFEPPAPPGSPRVRLALLDTAPTRPNPAGNPGNRSPHGYTLANMAEKLTCGAGGCAAAITARLALPWVVYDPQSFERSQRDDGRGGFVGLIGELAAAVRAEVVDWQPSAGSQSLVLNLSVGWNGRHFGGTDPAEHPAAQAVHAALVDAVCRGASVMVAAGNRTWGPDPSYSRGPLLPAAWEHCEVPTAPLCAAALAPGGPPPAIPCRGIGTNQPLVHAVGAVRADGAPLRNRRDHAEPELVAFGDHATVTAQGSPEPTATLTGSSVATVVASAAVAWVRFYLPKLNSNAAVGRLREHGDPLRRATFCHGGSRDDPCPPAVQPAPGVSRISVAKVACRVCQGPGCPPCPTVALMAQPPSVFPSGAVSAFSGARRIPLARLRSARPPREPNLQYFDTNLQAETGPQPGSNPCTACILDPEGGGSTSTAYIEIDPDYIGQLSLPVLRVGDQTYALGDLTQGEQWVVQGLPTGAVPTQLSFVVNGDSSATSLFLQPD